MARWANAGILLSIVGVVVFPCLAQAAESEALFQEKCSSCHSIGGGRRVGPDLIGVQDRRSESWLRSFIQSPQAMVAKDAEAKKLFDEYKMMMPGALLTDAQIPGVLGFIATKGRGEGQAASVPFAYSARDAEGGRLLFEGGRPFSRGGPACISCHNVNAGLPVPGGTLAKDLTGAFSR
ncbi:MAG: cytochrome c, partial [Bdellovibrionales bacterium]|nr:cytochrome c [Bdellovibrionales bacterium]